MKDAKDAPPYLTLGALAEVLARSGVAMTLGYSDGKYTARVTRGRRPVVQTPPCDELGEAVALAAEHVAGLPALPPKCPKCGTYVRMCSRRDPDCLHCDGCDWAGRAPKAVRS